MIPSADVTFAVATTAPLPVDTWVTNTAVITDPYNTVERSASTLINPVDMSTSFKKADKSRARLGDVVQYDLLLRNTGLAPATAILTDPIPVDTTYVPGSLTYAVGSGGHDPIAGVITWTGDIAPSGSVTLTFAVALTTLLPDRTPVSNTATLNNGYGDLHDLEAVFLARSSDLSASFKQADPPQARPGDTVTYTVYVRNVGAADTTSEMRDELPPELAYVPGSLVCGTGSCGEATGIITWAGTLGPRSMVPVRFRASVSPGAAHGDLITNVAVVTDTVWNIGYPVSAPVMVVSYTYGVMVAPSTGAQSGEPGSMVTYTLQVTNTSNATDMFSVTVGGNAWPTTADPATLGPLAADERAGVIVTVAIPTSTAGGDTDSAIVTITSQGDPTQSASATLTTLAASEEPPGWSIYMPLVLRSG